MTAKFIEVNALMVRQRKDVPLFVFGIEGRLVGQVASISYADRRQDGSLDGYQRAPVQAHIAAILEYISSPAPLLPNAIVLALEETVTFEPLDGPIPSEWGTFGRLRIPVPTKLSDPKPAWIVDGQQRATALGKLDGAKSLPVVVVGFRSGSRAVQMEQFLRVNKTKPLPRDLLHEILPEVEAPLSRDLQKRQLATSVVKIVRFDRDSPFYGRIRGLGSSDDDANISQAALIAVVENSIKARGALYRYFDGIHKKHNHKGMAGVVMAFFDGVRRVWPEAWEGNPKSSRLVHGVGIVSLGALMDRVMLEVDAESPRAAAGVASRLSRIKDVCAWTDGRWPVLGCRWNELQNTSQDKARLTDYLLKSYGAS